MLKKSIMSLVSVFVIAFTSMGSSNATEVNLGGFTGNVSTIVTHGVSIRAEDNNCFLVSGSQTTMSSALQELIGGNPHDGNGGCNYKRVDNFGNTASKVIDVGSVLGDDGRLNFQKGDVIDAGQSIALSFTGSNPDGVRLNLSGVAFANPVLDVNSVAFKSMTSDAKDHLENDFKLGNAFISAPVSSNLDITLGNYVQSQGVTALFPIGVNVVNPVSLPILRSPGAQLKDALLPQAMLGATAYLDGGVTMEAYVQLEQKPLELDASGTFFGSDLVGVGNSTGIISSAIFNEDTSLPIGQVYFDVASCVAGLAGLAIANAACDPATSGHLWDDDEDGWSIFHDLIDDNFGDSHASNITTQGAVANAGGSLDALFSAGIAGSGITGLDDVYDSLAGHAASSSVSMSNDRIRAAYNTLFSQYPGRGDMAGLLYIRRAPDVAAKDSGQFGVNLSGYIDDVGSGVEWGLYFNRSHSNTPRIRMLGIQDGYSTDMHLWLSAMTNPAGLNQYVLTDAGITKTEQAVASIAMGGSICGLISSADGAFKNATHIFDPAVCYQTQVLVAENDDTMLSAAVGAIATLGWVNGGRYQIYYPEDIDTYGLSLSTGINGWASNLEIAYRPDFPLQIHPGDLVNNLIDSTYGTVVQSVSTFAAAAAVKPLVAGTNWSAMPRCDLDSTTSKASLTNSGYAVCDGTAEFDVITANVNLAKSFTASEPFVVNAGADSATLLIDIGAVSVPDLDYAQGLVQSGQFASGHDVYQNGCLNGGGSNNLLTAQANGLFGNGYCESDSGPDDLAIAYKLRGSLTYNNFNNSKWAFSPSLGFNHDIIGNAPSSIGGFVEDRMSASATATFTSGGMSSSLSYNMELGDELNNSSVDKDYVSANFSYAF